MSTSFTHFRHAARGLAQRPGFSLVVVATLALGIGATTAIFSVVDAVVLRPLPFADSDELVMVWEHNFPRERDRNVVAGPNFLAWRETAESFEDLAAFVPWAVNLNLDGGPERVRAAAVTPGFFPILGVEPALGRRFAPEEAGADADPVVILTHDLWQRRFGGASDVVGQAFDVGTRRFTVIGVLPRGFKLPKVAPDYGPIEEAELFAPLSVSGEYQGRGMLVLGRLAPGVGLERAQAEMTAVARRLEQEHEYNEGWGANVVGLREQVVGGAATALFVILGAVGLVLAIACVNVVNLLLVRATTRRREMAVRASLGASRGHILAQLLAESLVLAVLGGGAGLLLAIWGVDLLIALAPEAVPRLAEVTVDARTFAFTAGVSLVVALVFALAPAARVARADLRDALGAAQRGTGDAAGQRLRHALVVAEVALALLLLLGSGLLIKSFHRLRNVEPGFDIEDLVSLKVALAGEAYSEDHQAVGFYRELRRRVEALPGVESAAATRTQPFDGMGIGTSFVVEGRPDPGRRDRPVADIRPVTSGYFATLGIPLVEGRDFDERDGVDSAPAAVVSQALARRFWPEGGALGKKVSVWLGEMKAYEIVGVVGDIRHMGLDSPPRSMIYLPHAHLPMRSMTLLVRSSLGMEGVAAAVRETLAVIDPSLPVHGVDTMAGKVSASVAEERFSMTLLATFAAVALALAAVGLYGLLSYSVSRSTHEIGIRLALGAGRGKVLGQVVRRAILLTAAGLALGMAGAVGMSRLVESLLFEVEAMDPATCLTVAAVLVAVALVASYLPARRASRVDPIVALHHE